MKKSAARRALSGAVLYGGTALTVLLAIPAAILLCAIAAIWRGTDRLAGADAGKKQKIIKGLPRIIMRQPAKR